MVEVLNKIHRALRMPGQLLIIQPHESIQRVEVEIQGRVIMKETLYGPDFAENLAATRTAIDAVVAGGMYAIVSEVVLPDHDCYESVDDWTAGGFLFDEGEALDLASRTRALLGDREHQVKLFGNEYTVLLRRSVIKQGST
jgi:hypothetical protein